MNTTLRDRYYNEFPGRHCEGGFNGSQLQEDILAFIESEIELAREVVIAHISLNQGWEKTGDIFREEFGLPKKYV